MGAAEKPCRFGIESFQLRRELRRQQFFCFGRIQPGIAVARFFPFPHGGRAFQFALFCFVFCLEPSERFFHLSVAGKTCEFGAIARPRQRHLGGAFRRRVGKPRRRAANK
jgi:hypothetical protein